MGESKFKNPFASGLGRVKPEQLLLLLKINVEQKGI